MSSPVADLQEHAIKIITTLRTATKGMAQPAITQIVNQYGRDPFLVLISCLLSLRTKDTVSLPAAHRLFQFAKNPKTILRLSIKKIETLIYPVAFYRMRAKQFHQISNYLLEQFDGKVPDTEKDLLSIKGVGRKTMNLVLAEGFLKPAICVDTHVHRISNRLGLVKTKTREETEAALKTLLPQKYWSEYNKLMVMWGQNICVPVSPFCSKCVVFDLCERRGVNKSR